MFEKLFEFCSKQLEMTFKNVPVVVENGDVWDTGQEQTFWKNTPNPDVIWKNDELL